MLLSSIDLSGTMLCLVSQPNSVVLEVEVDSKAKGKECLDKVCQMLGLIEADYFGLRYKGSNGEMYWINRRNEIRHQVSGLPPYRLQLQVKFYVPPHLLLHETTRYLFYIAMKRDYVEKKLMTTDLQSIQMTALMAQADIGDLNAATLSTSLLSYEQWSPRVKREEIALEHRRLAGTEPETARYRFIQAASEVTDFGVEYHHVKDNQNYPYKFGVGACGVVISSVCGHERDVITFPCILMASQSGKCFFLTYLQDTNICNLVYKSTRQTTNAIYRLVTEAHSFYSSETVTHAVLSQHVRDLKGTIASIFNDKTTLGKNYMFDVTRTFRQVYDDTRRLLHHAELSRDSAPMLESKKHREICSKSECKEIEDQLYSLQNSLLCHLCMDSYLDAVFYPCRHAVCCNECAKKCPKCPLCRIAVTTVSHIYLPVG